MVLSKSLKAGFKNFSAAIAVPVLALAISVAPVPMAIKHAQAQEVAGPVSVADLAERLLDSVVNISTTQKIGQTRPNVPIPKVPEGSPFKDFFDELLPDLDKNKKGKKRPRSRSSLGSGFVIDASGIIVTNNHVIADADEITVNFADGTKLEAELIGKDPKVDIAILRVKPEKPLTAVKFGDSTKSRIGDLGNGYW